MDDHMLQVRDNVAIHVPCTSKKLGVTGAFEQVAALCAKEVTPSGVPCCGGSPRPNLLTQCGRCMSYQHCDQRKLQETLPSAAGYVVRRLRAVVVLPISLGQDQ